MAGELSRRACIASITLRNTKGIDILATNRDVDRSVGIQVKTSQGAKARWLLNKKAEELIAQDLFYVFVRLNGLGQPAFHIVPSEVVAEHTRRTHREWLSKRGRDGQPHVDNPHRQFEDEADQFLDRWELLGL